jgi:hypothetical protein
MPISYLYAAIFLAGLVIGAGTAYKIEHANTIAMRLQVSEANNKVLAAQRDAQALVQTAMDQARQKNEELDNANRKAIETINHYYDANSKLIADRVRAASSSNCKNPVPTGNSPVGAKAETARPGLPEGFGEYLADRSRQATELAQYAKMCYQFVVENNCGIVK